MFPEVRTPTSPAYRRRGYASGDSSVLEEEVLRKVSNRIMIRMKTSRKEVEGIDSSSRSFDLPRAEGAYRITMEQQTQKNFQHNDLATAWT